MFCISVIMFFLLGGLLYMFIEEYCFLWLYAMVLGYIWFSVWRGRKGRFGSGCIVDRVVYACIYGVKY